MAVNPQAVGKEYGPFPPYEVSRVKIREFATAVGATNPIHHDVAAASENGHRDLVAPTTFAAVISQQAEFHVVQDAEVGVDFSRVVHASQRFSYVRPIYAGDELSAQIAVTDIVQRAQVSMVTTRADLRDRDGELVVAVTSTLAVREGE